MVRLYTTKIKTFSFE